MYVNQIYMEILDVKIMTLCVLNFTFFFVPISTLNNFQLQHPPQQNEFFINIHYKTNLKWL